MSSNVDIPPRAVEWIHAVLRDEAPPAPYFYLGCLKGQSNAPCALALIVCAHRAFGEKCFMYRLISHTSRVDLNLSSASIEKDMH